MAPRLVLPCRSAEHVGIETSVKCSQDDSKYWAQRVLQVIQTRKAQNESSLIILKGKRTELISFSENPTLPPSSLLLVSIHADNGR